MQKIEDAFECDYFNSISAITEEWGNGGIGAECGSCEAALFCLTGLYPPGIGIPRVDTDDSDVMWYRAGPVRKPIDQYRRAFRVRRSTCPKWKRLDYDD